MNISTALPVFAMALLIGCSSTKKKPKEPTPSPVKHAFQIHKANEAWANAEELNERVSPPQTAMIEGKKLSVAVHYSAPSVKGRTVWDSLVTLGEVWRTGANEATVIEFSDDVHIGDKHIRPGAYGLFTIPREDSWTVILNEVYDQWGAYEYDASKDVVRFEINDQEGPFTEALQFQLKPTPIGYELVFNWEKRQFSLPIEVSTDEEKG